jgi:hypothetical protein
MCLAGLDVQRRMGHPGKLDPVLVQPEAVAEVSVDVARAGRWRLPVKLQRIRTSPKPDDTQLP